MAIHNRPKRTIYASGGLELLQMVSEPHTELCTSKDARSQGGRLRDLTLVGEGNKAFLIRVWKPPPSLIRNRPKRTISTMH